MVVEAPPTSTVQPKDRLDFRDRNWIGWRLIQELAVILTVLLMYSVISGLSIQLSHLANRHAQTVWSFEKWLHLPSEGIIQRATLSVPHLINLANLYYWVHLPLTFGVIIWVVLRRTPYYPWLRWTLLLVSGIALIGYLLYPLTPPRLTHPDSIIDTGARFGPISYPSSPGSDVTNQYAAMPSQHMAWALLIAITMITTTYTTWRWLWLLHPTLTLWSITATANHYWLDAIAGAALLTTTLTLTAHWYTRAKQTQPVLSHET